MTSSRFNFFFRTLPVMCCLLWLGACGGSNHDIIITKRQLDRLPPALTGILTPDRGGLPAHAWDGTSHKKAVELIDNIPDNLTSPSLRTLARKVLLSATWPPKPSTHDAPDSQSGILTARINKLQRMGLIDDAAKLFLAIHHAPNDPKLFRAGIDALFLSGRIDEACLETMVSPQRFKEGFWLRTVTMCQLYSGDYKQGAQSLKDVEKQEDTSPVFLSVGKWMITRDDKDLPKPDTVHKYGLDALSAGVLLAHGHPFVFDSQSDDGAHLAPALAYAIAKCEKLSPQRRLKAGFVAALNGSMTPELLAKIYEKNRSRITIPKAAADIDNSLPPFERSASIYLAAKNFLSLEDRMRMIEADIAAQKSPLLATAQVYNNLLTPSDNSDLHSPPKSFVWSLLFTAGLDNVVEWTDFYGSHKFGDLEGQSKDGQSDEPNEQDADKNTKQAKQQGGKNLTDQVSTSLLPVLFKPIWDIANGALPEKQDLEKFLDAASRQDPVPDTDRIFAVISAMGGKVEKRQRQTAARLSGRTGKDGVKNKDLARLIWKLDNAAAEERVAETVLISLAVLGRTGTDKAPTQLVESTIKNLRSIGLEKEARTIAVEVMATAID